MNRTNRAVILREAVRTRCKVHLWCNYWKSERIRALEKLSTNQIEASCNDNCGMWRVATYAIKVCCCCNCNCCGCNCCNFCFGCCLCCSYWITWNNFVRGQLHWPVGCDARWAGWQAGEHKGLHALHWLYFRRVWPY